MTRFRTSRNQHDDSFFKSEFMAIVKKDMWIWCRFFVFLGSVWQMEPMSNSWKTHFRIFTARWIISKKKTFDTYSCIGRNLFAEQLESITITDTGKSEDWWLCASLVLHFWDYDKYSGTSVLEPLLFWTIWFTTAQKKFI